MKSGKSLQDRIIAKIVKISIYCINEFLMFALVPFCCVSPFTGVKLLPHYRLMRYPCSVSFIKQHIANISELRVNEDEAVMEISAAGFTLVYNIGSSYSLL